MRADTPDRFIGIVAAVMNNDLMDMLEMNMFGFYREVNLFSPRTIWYNNNNLKKWGKNAGIGLKNLSLLAF